MWYAKLRKTIIETLGQNILQEEKEGEGFSPPTHVLFDQQGNNM